MAEYSRIAKGHFTSTGAAQVINLPFIPGSVFMYNYSSAATPANHGIPFAYWSSAMGQGYAQVQLFNATPVLTTGVITTNGISSFSGGLSFQYGPVFNNTSNAFSISKANPAVVTTSSAHGLASGNVVIFSDLYETSTTGMPQLSGIPFVITVTAATTFTIPWNTNQSNYTAFNTATSTNNVGSFKQILYPFLYAPGVSFISALTLGSTTTVVTTAPHNMVAGQIVAFRIPPVWGTTQLNSLPDVAIPGQPIYGYVTSVTNSTTLVVSINSSAYTAFANNPTVLQLPGLTPPQMIAVGDINTGGLAYSGGALYPSPLVAGASTINGPAINGAFVNNTSMGLIIGAGAAASDGSSVLVGAAGNLIYYEAFLHDYVI